MPPPVLFVFSHLRWNFMFQRPQQLMSRLAGRWRVLFVEEPVRSEGPARLEVREVRPGLTVLVPHTPVEAAGFHDDQLAGLTALLERHVQARRLCVGVAWLTTPMALPLAQTVAPACVVYDCMVEPSALSDAPRQWRQRESALMKTAALVLTGGPSLYEAKRGQHPQVVCLPSAVDAAHFSPANLLPGGRHAAEAGRLQGALPRPRLGWFGTVDERLDLGLLTQVADAHPDWSVVMAGPVVRIEAAALPQRPNLHWLGPQPYDRLPYLLAGWDVALLPFALNEATRFTSAGQTLQYLAGEKAVVSTPVHDVIALYGDAVAVVHGAPAFIAACERVIDESPAARCRRASAMINMVALHAWDHSADCVHWLLVQALSEATLPATAAATDLPSPVLAQASQRR